MDKILDWVKFGKPKDSQGSHFVCENKGGVTGGMCLNKYVSVPMRFEW